MENKVKATATGVNPKTGEIHHMEFEGDAVCIVTINDAGPGVSSEECLVGSVNLDRAMAMVKGLTSACNHLLKELPPALSGIIMAEMMAEIMAKPNAEKEEETADELA